MEWTEQQKQEFRRVFAIRRKRQLAIGGLVLIVIIAVVTGWIDAGTATRLGLPGSALELGLAGLIVTAAALSLWNWRCPSCNGYLGKGLGPRFCPKCGAPLR